MICFRNRNTTPSNIDISYSYCKMSDRRSPWHVGTLSSFGVVLGSVERHCGFSVTIGVKRLVTPAKN